MKKIMNIILLALLLLVINFIPVFCFYEAIQKENAEIKTYQNPDFFTK